jgi:hypothetical protein
MVFAAQPCEHGLFSHSLSATLRVLLPPSQQILFDKQHTPIFDTGLTLGMRLLYTSGELHSTCP